MHNVIMDSGHTCTESRHLLPCLRVLVAAAPEMALSECIRYSVINCGPIGTAASGWFRLYICVLSYWWWDPHSDTLTWREIMMACVFSRQGICFKRLAFPHSHSDHPRRKVFVSAVEEDVKFITIWEWQKQEDLWRPINPVVLAVSPLKHARIEGRRVLQQQLVVAQIVKKFPAFREARRRITEFRT